MTHSSLHLAFVWHMHQPDYRNANGIMMMPWVFLHAIKDYYEMPWLLRKHPHLKATFNITAPLIEQLELYKAPLENDYFLGLWSKHPTQLEPSGREWMIKMCRSTQFDTMVRPLPHYALLHPQEQFDDASLIDLQILFMLAWCGNYARQHLPTVTRLIAQGKHYTQEDKTLLLDALVAFVATILPYYAALQNEGHISVSTTPYNHPILPLLLDMQNAKRANTHAVLPANPLSMREDAQEQIARAITLYEATFGRKPSGMWPAEGAVDEESLRMYRAQGISWVATDEAILFGSLGHGNREVLYRPYSYEGVTIGFRDHAISDLIGFAYRFKKPHEAAEHFMHTIAPLARSVEESATLFVILDGENAWEFYPNNGLDFFEALYGALSRSQTVHTVTMEQVTQAQKATPLAHLATGSWIGGNFATWSGHPEKNRAWEMIYQAKRDVAHRLESGAVDETTQARVRFHFLASQCSDWFWWYGDDHSTEFGVEFDALFRGHLIAIYRLLEMVPPSDLFTPIIAHKSSASFMYKPKTAISPHIDGRRSTFFEWLDSGRIDESKLFSTMDKARGPIVKINYGYDDAKLYVAFEGEIGDLLAKGAMLHIYAEESDAQWRVPIEALYQEQGVFLVCQERIEMALDLTLFGSVRKFRIRFEIIEASKIVQILPGFGALNIDLDDTYEDNWFI
ncbi:MAG: glycoside hydrolase [Sulfuricurvum sp. PC08-66]|nr:MAG: glycoside hydrolase [Sulfuricurvum sp. PC08-66]